MAVIGAGQAEPAAEPIKLDERAEIVDALLAAIYGTLSPDVLAQKVRRSLFEYSLSADSPHGSGPARRILLTAAASSSTSSSFCTSIRQVTELDLILLTTI